MVFFACGAEQAEREFMQLSLNHLMETMNDTVVRQAQTYVWGTDDSHLRFVKNRMGKRSQPYVRFRSNHPLSRRSFRFYERPI